MVTLAYERTVNGSSIRVESNFNDAPEALDGMTPISGDPAFQGWLGVIQDGEYLIHSTRQPDLAQALSA